MNERNNLGTQTPSVSPSRETKTKVIIFGTFDGLHKGHIHFIQESQKLGKELKIIVARDQNVKNIKNKHPILTEKERLNSVQKAFSFAKVELGDLVDFYRPIQEYQPDVIALGYDQKADLGKIREKFPDTKIIKISAFKPEKYKSSLLNS